VKGSGPSRTWLSGAHFRSTAFSVMSGLLHLMSSWSTSRSPSFFTRRGASGSSLPSGSDLLSDIASCS
jgi:hypothetical protein